MATNWRLQLKKELQAPYFKQLIAFVNSEYATATVYPPIQQLFAAFNFTAFAAVKVVIIGQDPYHGPGQANGLAFSVARKQPIPPSLQNIYRALERDLAIAPAGHGSLQAWAESGVLLLNTVLSVRANEPQSHKNQGWEQFSAAVISHLNRRRNNLVFMLWGKNAQSLATNINSQHHLVLTAAHPSPLAAYRGFFDCRHFSKANNYLVQHGQTAIDWQL